MEKKGYSILGIKLIAISLLLLVSFSCKKSVKKNKEPQQLQIESLTKQAEDSFFKNNTFSKSNYQAAFKLVTDSVSYYEILSKISACHLNKGQYDSALFQSKRIFAYINRQELTPRIHSLLSEVNNTIGNYYSELSNIDSSLLYYSKAYKQVQLSDRHEKTPDICINLADIYNRKGDYVNGVFYYRKALSVSDSLQSLDKMGFPIYFGLGQTYMELRDFDLSDTYYNKAWAFYESRDLREKFIYSNNRGNYYFYKEEYAKALPWFQRARALVLPGNYQFYINLCEGNMGDIYLRLNKLDSAQYYLDRSFNFFTKQQNQSILYYLATAKAGLYIQQNKLEQAAKLLNTYNDSKGIEPNVLSVRNDYLEDYNARIGNYKLAYAYQTKNLHLNDSIRTERVKMRAAEIDMRYQQDTTMIKQKMLIRNQYSQMKNLRLKNFIWILVAAFVLILALFGYAFMRKQRDLQWRKHFDQVTKLRMESIRNRISPHFVFNILNREMSSSDNKSSHSELSGLVKLLRQSLEMTEQISISLTKELAFIKEYLILEKNKLGEDFRLDLEINEQVNTDLVFLPAMIIQIPVENAIKHALRPKKGEKLLRIAISSVDNCTKIIIQDNGAGYHPGATHSPNSTGTGLKVLYQTIQLLNTKNTNKISYAIENINEPNTSGTRVNILIPTQYSFDL